MISISSRRLHLRELNSYELIFLMLKKLKQFKYTYSYLENSDQRNSMRFNDCSSFNE